MQSTCDLHGAREQERDADDRRAFLKSKPYWENRERIFPYAPLWVFACQVRVFFSTEESNVPGLERETLSKVCCDQTHDPVRASNELSSFLYSFASPFTCTGQT